MYGSAIVAVTVAGFPLKVKFKNETEEGVKGKVESFVGKVKRRMWSLRGLWGGHNGGRRTPPRVEEVGRGGSLFS